MCAEEDLRGGRRSIMAWLIWPDDIAANRRHSLCVRAAPVCLACSPAGLPCGRAKLGWPGRWAAGTIDAMPPRPALLASGLVKDYRRGRAVDGVDLRVGPGERVALLGPNGAGKTTTLLMCLGAVTPDAGSVEILGHRLPHDRYRAMAQVGFGAGYLPLPERMRVIEYLRMFGRLAALRRPDEAARDALDRFGIGQLARAHATELSSGQKTLVGIAKAIMHRPALLILDEPTASLDPDVALRVRNGLRE